jgi:hypothetical protein
MQPASNSSQYEMFFLISEIASALWVHIQSFEVTLRNFLFESLSIIYKSNEWWLIPNLLSLEESSNVRKTLKSLEKHKIGITPSSVVEHMGLSFWIKLLGKRYHQKIWMKILKFFPVYPGRREDFYNKAREIRNLRNSIAHHGPIMRRDLIRDHAYLGELTAILDPELAREVEKRSRVLDLLLNARLVGSGGGI